MSVAATSPCCITHLQKDIFKASILPPLVMLNSRQNLLELFSTVLDTEFNTHKILGHCLCPSKLKIILPYRTPFKERSESQGCGRSRLPWRPITSKSIPNQIGLGNKNKPNIAKADKLFHACAHISDIDNSSGRVQKGSTH